MSENRGVSPSRPRPNPRPASPEKPKTYSDLTAEKRLLTISLLANPFQEVLAEIAAEREASVADEHVRAA